MVRFLLSDEAAYITGTSIVVDGGMTALGPGLMETGGHRAGSVVARRRLLPDLPALVRRLERRRRRRSAGIISRLDYLAELGIAAIWLSPITVSPNRDWGYDVADYRDIDPDFGTLDDLRHAGR